MRLTYIIKFIHVFITNLKRYFNTLLIKYQYNIVKTINIYGYNKYKYYFILIYYIYITIITNKLLLINLIISICYINNELYFIKFIIINK